MIAKAFKINFKPPSTQQMNQLQCKIGEIAQEIVRGILTGKDISKARHNTPRGPNAISRW